MESDGGAAPAAFPAPRKQHSIRLEEKLPGGGFLATRYAHRTRPGFLAGRGTEKHSGPAASESRQIPRPQPKTARPHEPERSRPATKAKPMRALCIGNSPPRILTLPPPPPPSESDRSKCKSKCRGERVLRTALYPTGFSRWPPNWKRIAEQTFSAIVWFLAGPETREERRAQHVAVHGFLDGAP